MLKGVLEGIIKKSGIKPDLVEDVSEEITLQASILIIIQIAVGTVLTPGGGATLARAACLAAGFPSSPTAVNTVNRQVICLHVIAIPQAYRCQCSSGLMACVQIAHEIQSGMVSTVIQFLGLKLKSSIDRHRHRRRHGIHVSALRTWRWLAYGRISGRQQRISRLSNSNGYN